MKSIEWLSGWNRLPSINKRIYSDLSFLLYSETDFKCSLSGQSKVEDSSDNTEWHLTIKKMIMEFKSWNANLLGHSAYLSTGKYFLVHKKWYMQSLLLHIYPVVFCLGPENNNKSNVPLDIWYLLLPRVSKKKPSPHHFPAEFSSPQALLLMLSLPTFGTSRFEGWLMKMRLPFALLN